MPDFRGFLAAWNVRARSGMRALITSSLFIAVLGAPGLAQAQSAAAFPDVGSRAHAAQSQPAPAQQSAAAWTPRPSAPAVPAVASMNTFTPQPWAPPRGGYTLRRAEGPTPDVPPGFMREKRPRTLTLALGGVALGLPWATGLGIAAGSGFANGSGWLIAPVIGPWAALAKRSNPCEGVDKAKSFNSKVSQCVAEPITRAMLVFDGVLQATGAVLLVFGAQSDTVLVRRSPPESAHLAVAPSPVGDSGYGVQMLGLF